MKKHAKDKRILAAEVAQRYYLGDPPMTQRGIAKELKVNEATVSRLLQYARQEGLVEISLCLPRDRQFELMLIREYDLVEAVVAPILPPDESRRSWMFRKQLATEAARHLDEDGTPLKSGGRVGISCGATLRYLVSALTPRRFSDMTISQLTVETEIDQSIDVSPFTLVGMLFAKWNAENLERRQSEVRGGANPSPQVYAVQPLPGSMRKDSQWASEYKECWDTIMKMAKELDVAILGISSCGQGDDGGSLHQILVRHNLNPGRLARKGVVGEICNRPYDKDGNDMTGEVEGLSDYVDGVELSVLQGLVANGRKVIAIAGGDGKRRAIQVALRSKFVNYLITDSATAEWLCQKR